MSSTVLTPLQAAQGYRRNGMSPIPVPPHEKNPGRRGWEQLIIPLDELPRYFNGGAQNIGILCGAPSGDLVDVDLDAPEAVTIGARLLPPTELRHGRGRKPHSHYWYRAPGVKTERFKFIECDQDDATCLAELRGTGTQTLVAPSEHDKDRGDRYVWHARGPAAALDAAATRRLVARVAAGAVLARHWPATGARDDAALALAGMLAHAGWSAAEIDAFVLAVAEAAGDEEGPARGSKGQRAVARVAAGEAVTGAPTLAEVLRDGRRVVDKAREWLGIAASVPQPQPPDAPNSLFSLDSSHADAMSATSAATRGTRLADWPDPMDAAAYIGPMGAFVRKQAPQTEAAPEALLVQALAAVGSAMGRHAYCSVEADTHGTNLSTVMTGGTGARKGVGWNHVRRFMRRVDPEWESEHLVNGLSTGEGLISLVRDDEPQILDKVALAFESEFASVFRVKGREGNTLSMVLRQAWDGDTLRTMTKHTPLKATGAHISIVGHITPEELRRLMSETDAGNGFGNRILWVCAKRARYLPHGGAEVDVNAEVAAIHDAIVAAKQGGVRRLQRDAEADALWEQRYRDLSSGRPGLLGAVTNRAEAQVTRLSLVYALAERSPVITRRHLAAALAVWDYCLASARFLFGAALGDALAEELDQALARRGEAGMSRTDISALFGNNRSADELANALGVLAGQNRAQKRRVKGEGGRAVDRWYTVPYDENSENTADCAAYPPQNSFISLNSSPAAQGDAQGDAHDTADTNPGTRTAAAATAAGAAAVVGSCCRYPEHSHQWFVECAPGMGDPLPGAQPWCGICRPRPGVRSKRRVTTTTATTADE